MHSIGKGMSKNGAGLFRGITVPELLLGSRFKSRFSVSKTKIQDPNKEVILLLCDKKRPLRPNSTKQKIETNSCC